MKKIIYLLLPEKISKRLKFKSFFSKNCFIGDYCEIDDESTLDNHVLIAHHASIRASNIGEYSAIGRYTKVNYAKIGKFCSISWDVTIGAIHHPFNRISSHAFSYVPEVGHFVEKREQTHEEVIIGHDVWIGCNSVIMPGVKIEHGAVIGASAVVTKDVPPYAIVAGVPAKIIGYRFNEEIINKLLEIKWWDMDRQEIKENIEIFKKTLDNKVLDELYKIIKK